MLTRRPLIAAAASALLAGPALAASRTPARPAWAEQIATIRISEISGTGDADRMARLAQYVALLQSTFSVPVKLELAPDYGTLVERFVEKRLEMAYTSPAAYAAAWVATNHNVVPLVAVRQGESGHAYRAALVVRADSDIHTLGDLQGHSLAWDDQGSAAGYLVPRAAFIQMGIDTDQGTFFGHTVVAPGKLAGVQGVLDGKWTAAFARIPADGDPAKAQFAGMLGAAADRNQVDLSKLRVIWTSPPMRNGPVIVRADTPASFQDDMRNFHLTLAQKHPDVMAALHVGHRQQPGTFVPVTHGEYDQIIQLIAPAVAPTS